MLADFFVVERETAAAEIVFEELRQSFFQPQRHVQIVQARVSQFVGDRRWNDIRPTFQNGDVRILRAEVHAAASAMLAIRVIAREMTVVRVAPRKDQDRILPR